MIKWSAIDISWCMISNQPVGSSLDTQPTAAVRRASILTRTNMGVFQSNYTDFVGIFMKEQWERLREHYAQHYDSWPFQRLFLLSTPSWAEKYQDGLEAPTSWGFLIPSDSDWVGLDRVLTISMEWATLQPCYVLVAQWRCGHTKWDFWCWLLHVATIHYEPSWAPD